MSQQFVLLLSILSGLLRAQNTEPTSTQDKVCITGSTLPGINGTYSYAFWDTHSNGPTYYNSITNQYLYPLIQPYASSRKFYLISNDTNNNSSSLYCEIPPTNYFNPDYCHNNWLSIDNQTNQYSPDNSIILVNCNDICVSGNYDTSLNGVYKWLHFEQTTNSSVYYCSTCSTYLYGWIFSDGRNWRLGDDYHSSVAHSACNLNAINVKYVFNLNDCTSWYSWVNNAWYHRVIIAKKCASTSFDPANWISTDHIIFGFSMPTIGKSVCCNNSSHTIIMTLFWDEFRYQCDIRPKAHNTYYSCKASISNMCRNSLSSTYGIQLNTNNSVDIDSIQITNSAGQSVYMEYFCWNSSVNTSNFEQYYKIDDNCFDIIPLQQDIKYSHVNVFIPLNQQYLKTYVYKKITTNISSCNYIPTNASVASFKSLSYPCCLQDNGTCVCIHNTRYYGGDGGGKLTAINQGRITGILLWGIRKDWSTKNALCYFQWTSDLQTIFEIAAASGYEADCTLCDPFQLDEDDYINGYRIKYGFLIYGIYFYTKKGYVFNCVGDFFRSPSDSEEIKLDGYYLSGFNINSGTAMDRISFQFTLLNSNDSTHDNCTISNEKYILVPVLKSWRNAQEICRQYYETDLATILTEYDMEIASNIRNSDDIYFNTNLWIGLNANEGNWIWVDNSQCQHINHALCIDNSTWAVGKPNDGNNSQDCVELTVDNKFNDIQCNVLLIFMCNNPKHSTYAPTVVPTMQTKHILITNNSNIIWITMGILIVVLIAVIVIYYKRKNKKIVSENKELKEQQAKYTHYITNPLVLYIGIEYYNKVTDTPHAITNHIDDLDGIDNDYENVDRLCKLFNYVLFPKELKLEWTQEEIITFLQKHADNVSKNIDKLEDDNRNPNKQVNGYDGIIFIFSGHGYSNHLITSDNQLLHKTAIHRLFSTNYPELREIPRIFLFDSCEGTQTQSSSPSNRVKIMKKSKSRYNVNEKAKSFGVSDIKSDRAGGVWKADEKSLDYKLSLIHGANDGFQAKLNIQSGSYLIREFVDKLVKAKLENKNVFFGEVIDEIQNELLEQSKQHVVATFNNHSRCLKFKTNNCHLKKATDETEKKEENKRNFEVEMESMCHIESLSSSNVNTQSN
eukprot:523351_1